MKQLNETAEMMQSSDYKERFASEYYQNETRYLKLKAMTKKWDEQGVEGLGFTPTCPRKTYDRQLSAMLAYLFVLLDRAEMEGVKLEIDPAMDEEFEAHTSNQVIMSKQVRIDTDEVLRKLHNMEGCREVSLAITKLQEGVMWMGMNLKRLNQPNPYPNSRNTNNEKIEPTADNLNF